ncbi:DUF2141 domain-containing protein [uncultured Paraglaciecola sp.]|uniref:DUF2141 domain-containing protein n=1 Tax=uncultured Paraglaciecola sp. TaxID=1765024 RepID=UPI00261A369F|nr:DUF2141 domain-containing protein [uncultured Paraglaciecola sp.]
MKILVLYCCFIYALLSANFAESATLMLDVQGHKKYAGQLHIDISQVDGEIQQGLVWKDLIPVRKLTKTIDSAHSEQQSVELKIEDLLLGSICIRLYLDLNNNQILERSSIGLPLEPVGFSNNPSLFNGEPTPQDSCFMLQQTTNYQSITLKHNKRRR